MRLLIDADTQDALLVEALRVAGHDAQTVNEAGLRTARDPAILNHSIHSDRILSHAMALTSKLSMMPIRTIRESLSFTPTTIRDET